MLRAEWSLAFRALFDVRLMSVWRTNAKPFDPEAFIDIVLKDRSQSLGDIVYAKHGDAGLAVLRGLLPRQQHGRYAVRRRAQAKAGRLRPLPIAKEDLDESFLHSPQHEGE